MDTISRDSNGGGMLPWVGVIVGGFGLILGGIALAKVSSVSTAVTQELTPRVEAAEQAAKTADAKAANIAATYAKASDVQMVLDTIGTRLGTLDGDMKALKEAAAKKPAAAGTTPKGPVVAGKDEYVVKSGDTGTKIAKATGFSVKDLEAVNPGIDWTKLKVDQKLKLPAKK